MSRKCELSGVGVLSGNKVSHSQRKTRRTFKPNIKSVKFSSALTGQTYKLKVSACCIRFVEKAGGLDEYLIKVKEDVLSLNAQGIKRRITKKLVELKNEA